MNINEIQKLTIGLIEEKFETLQIEKDLFKKSTGLSDFNKHIRDNVKSKNGVYILFDPVKQKPIYIGMAGRIRNDGNSKDHPLNKRLTAPRYQDKQTKKWIQTNQYICDCMEKNSINKLLIYVFYTLPKVPPAYLESLLIYKFYSKYNMLPSENNEF
jgi:hypothetical protein